MSDTSESIIIIGAGLVGLTLAQSLSSAGIPFHIYERSPSLSAHNGGWAITLHWVLPFLQQNASEDLVNKIRAHHVQPEVLGKEKVPIVFQDLKSGKALFRNESEVHLRVDRGRLREVLAEGVDVQWGKNFEGYSVDEETGLVTARFEDGSEVCGSLLAIAEGKNSIARHALLGDAANVYDLPIGFIGLQLKGTAEEMAAYRNVAPIFWQGAHPETGYFIFCSMLSTPETNGSHGAEKQVYEVQLNMSWMLEEHANEKPPKTNEEKVRKLKDAVRAGEGFYGELREAILRIPEDVTALDIKLQDWPPEQWPNHGGRITFLGDAAHPMTMYRGQAANHGMYDAVCLANRIEEWWCGNKKQEQIVAEYEKEMIERTNKEVLLSRQACIEAHYPKDLKTDGALLTLVSKPESIPDANLY